MALTLAVLCGQSRAQTTKPNYYPANSDGLGDYFRDMLTAADKNDQQRLLLMCQALVIPKPQEWFKNVFGKEKGPKLADTYEKEMTSFGPGLARLFMNLDDPKNIKVLVTRIETPEDPSIKLAQTYALEAMQNPVTLYSIVLKKEGTTATIGLWSLVYVDDNFRMAGKMLLLQEMAKNPK